MFLVLYEIPRPYHEAGDQNVFAFVQEVGFKAAFRALTRTFLPSQGQ
jgi:hypothetical protein